MKSNQLSIVLSSYISKHIENVSNLSENSLSTILAASEAIVRCINNGGKLMICGNGGSAADSQHLAAELVGRFKSDRRALPAISLTTDTSAITSIGNDYNFEHIFTRQIQGIGHKGDVLLTISTSGNSTNILKAAEYAKENDIFLVGLTGESGGILNKYADINITVPSHTTSHIQEMHIIVVHLLCTLIEKMLFIDNSKED